MALAKSQRSLKAWGKQKWRTKSGKKSSETGERYLPEKAIKSLSSAEYAATTKTCLLYTSPSPRDGLLSRMPSSA